MATASLGDIILRTDNPGVTATTSLGGVRLDITSPTTVTSSLGGVQLNFGPASTASASLGSAQMILAGGFQVHYVRVNNTWVPASLYRFTNGLWDKVQA